MARSLQLDQAEGHPWQLNFGGKLPSTPRAKASPSPLSRPSTPHAGPKTCTQCGTGRTPQWREGPAGPKTLCNACGVKLVRKNRGAAEAKKRASPAADKATHPLLFADRNSPSPEPWSDLDSGADEAAQLADVEPSRLGFAAGKRPQRKAAVRAASRTAEFASTGDWPAEDFAAGDALSDASMGGSDSAEEVAWTPGEGAPPAAPRSTLPIAVRQQTSAAINLLTMSFKDEKDASPSTPTGQAQQVASPRTDACVPFQDAQAARTTLRLGLLRANSQLSNEERSVEAFMRQNAPARHSQYEALQVQAEAVWRKATACDAAVAAVAKFLAQKQAAAIRAREAARIATQELHSYLADTDAELGISRVLKRQRQ